MVYSFHNESHGKVCTCFVGKCPVVNWILTMPTLSLSESYGVIIGGRNRSQAMNGPLWKHFHKNNNSRYLTLIPTYFSRRIRESSLYQDAK